MLQSSERTGVIYFSEYLPNKNGNSHIIHKSQFDCNNKAKSNFDLDHKFDPAIFYRSNICSRLSINQINATNQSGFNYHSMT